MTESDHIRDRDADDEESGAEPSDSTESSSGAPRRRPAPHGASPDDTLESGLHDLRPTSSRRGRPVRPGPHGAPGPHDAGPHDASGPPDAPGSHGARPHDASGGELDLDREEAIHRAYRRAQRSSRRSFEEVTPRIVTAAEAATALDDEWTDEEEATGRALAKSRACFIATAAYGDADAPEVERLRRFRDRYLVTNAFGSAFIRFYYHVSPPFARLIARRPRLRTAVRRCLDLLP